MKTIPLSELFTISYGNHLDLNKMELQPETGINFISRSSQNLGVVAKVKPIDLEPFRPGMITVTLGGSYLLSAFVQPHFFYTAQNLKVLSPKIEMTVNEKVYYCLCIAQNRFRYSSHGREANKSLDTLLVPEFSEKPDWVNTIKIDTLIDYEKVSETSVNINKITWEWFEYDQLFNIERGRGARASDVVDDGETPFVTSTDSNNGITGYVHKEPQHQGNVITVNRNGSVGEAFYQKYPFCSTEDVHIFIPNFKMNPYIGLFLTTLIKKEKFRYSYGRKWGLERMRKTKIKLPVNQSGNPDWPFIEEFIKSLPYSKGLE